MTPQVDFSREANVLIYDLELSPSLMYAYGYYDAKVVRVVEQPILLSVAWKWLGEKKTSCLTIDDFSNGKEDTGLVRKLWHLLDSCEVAVAYNGKRFDQKVANTLFLQKGMKPPRPYKEFDPLQTARRHFRFGSNRLDYVGKMLVNDGKTELTYGDCWEDLLLGKGKKRKQAAKIMKLYNKKDVELLEKVYKKLRPWATNHPNMALHSGVEYVCPRCGWDSEFRVKAYRKTGVQVNAVQLLCKHCGAYVTRPLTKEEKEELDATGSLKARFRNLSP